MPARRLTEARPSAAHPAGATGSRTAAPALPNSAVGRAVAAGAPAEVIAHALGAPVARRALQRHPTRPTGPARGANPADQVAGLLAHVRRAPVGTRGQRQALIGQWMQRMTRLLDRVSGSGAGHESAIVANERAELAGHRTSLEEAAANLRSAQDFRDAVIRLTEAKARELRVQFTHNVVVQSGASGWSAGDLTYLDEALTGMPVDTTWSSAAPVTFAPVERREGSREGGQAETHLSQYPGGLITMFQHGMSSAAWKPSCPSLGGVQTHRHTIRHELGHVIHHRVPDADLAQLYTTIMDWNQYSLDALARGAAHPAGAEMRRLLMAETGLREPEIVGWLATIPAAPADDTGRRVTRGRRSYFKSSGGMLHSTGRPNELPQGREFWYAFWSQSEYFAEIYAYAINNPAFLASKISAGQKRWWKEKVFRVPVDPAELKRQMSVPGAVESPFLAAAQNLFTWEQLDAKLSELTAQQISPAPALSNP